MSQIPDKLKLNIHLMADVDTLSVRATSLRDEVRGEITPPSINLLKRLANHNLSDIPQAILYAVGKTLYVRLTAGNIGQLLQETLHEAAKSKQTVQLNLIFEADQLHLTQFPWEMMADDMGRFLLREGLVDVTRFIHYPQSVPRLHAPLEESPFLRAVAQPNGLPLLKPMALPLRKLDTLPNANLDQLSQRLLIERRNIWGMQFDGYSGVVQQCLYCQTLNPLQSVSCYRCGVSSADAPTVSALAFENEGEAAWISTTRLGELFFNTQGQNTPATLLTMPYAPEINLGGEHLLFHGAAPHLVLAGVPAVMGLQFSASYEFTSNFMNQFYLALLEHHDPQIAMRLARQQSSRETWYSPILYLRHKKLPDITASSDHTSPTRNIDTLVPNQVRTGKTFFVRLWIRRPDPFILRQGPSQAGIPFQSPQTNGAKIDLDPLDLGRTETDLIEHLIQERAIRYGDLEVHLSPSDDASGMYTITPNKVKLFVDDKVDAPPAVFTIKTQQAGPFSLNFSLWQDGEEIASVIREIQAVDGSLPSRVVLENNSFSIAIRGLISDVPSVHLETGTVCPNCGSNNHPHARYCSHCGYPLEEAYSLQSGRLPGDRPPPPGPLTPNFYLDKRYLINRQIEQDGIGVTYQAIDTRLHQRCLVRETIFVIPPNTLEWEHTFANFNREAQVLAALYHPNLRHLNDYFSAGGRHYTIFQYVEGLTLHERMALRDRQPMPEPLVQAIGVQLCSLLEYLHGHTLIWLDIQPKNLIFQDDGQVVMTNLFPLSSRGGVPTGTTSTSSRSALVSNFTAPEVYKNQADARSNIYAVGMTMYYLLTGEAPPNLQTLSQFDPRPRLNQYTSAELSAIVSRALHYNPAERWQSATEMAWALQGITLRERLGSMFEYGINSEQRRYAWSMSDAQADESERQPETPKNPAEWDTVRSPSPQATPLTQDLLTWLSRFFWLPIPILLTLLLCSGLILFGINNLLPRQTTIVPTSQNEGLISGSNVTSTLNVANDLTVLPTLTNTPMPTFTPIATRTPTPPPALSPSPTTPPLPSATPTPEPITGRVVIDGPGTLNIRQAPNLNTARVGLLDQGEVVTIISRNDQGDWFEILSPDGLQGWVSAQFLEVSGNFNAIEQNVDLPPSPVTGVVSIDGTSDLNVRQGPDVTYNLVSDLPNGTTVTLLRRTGLNDWFEVSLPEGGTGWVSADFITVSGDLSEVELIAGVP